MKLRKITAREESTNLHKSYLKVYVIEARNKKNTFGSAVC